MSKIIYKNNPNSRRVQILRVTTSAFNALFFSNNHMVITTNFPKDCCMETAHYNHQMDAWDIKIKSIEFPEVQEGEILPLYKSVMIQDIDSYYEYQKAKLKE